MLSCAGRPSIGDARSLGTGWITGASGVAGRAELKEAVVCTEVTCSTRPRAGSRPAGDGVPPTAGKGAVRLPTWLAAAVLPREGMRVCTEGVESAPRAGGAVRVPARTGRRDLVWGLRTGETCVVSVFVGALRERCCSVSGVTAADWSCWSCPCQRRKTICNTMCRCKVDTV